MIKSERQTDPSPGEGLGFCETECSYVSITGQLDQKLRAFQLERQENLSKSVHALVLASASCQRGFTILRILQTLKKKKTLFKGADVTQVPGGNVLVVIIISRKTKKNGQIIDFRREPMKEGFEKANR